MGNKCKDTSWFINKANNIHGLDIFNYDLVEYKDSHTKVKIRCINNHVFLQTPTDHFRKLGCNLCRIPSYNDKINILVDTHKGLYDYSLIKEDFKTTDIIPIICKKHGLFQQNYHLHYYKKCGCPKCNSSKGELLVEEFLKSNNIEYKSQYRFKGCRYLKPLPFDFYLPKYNICIEFDGEQHFKQSKRFKGKLEDIQYKDQIKTKYCIENIIKLIRISYLDIENIERILTSELKL